MKDSAERLIQIMDQKVAAGIRPADAWPLAKEQIRRELEGEPKQKSKNGNGNKGAGAGKESPSGEGTATAE